MKRKKYKRKHGFDPIRIFQWNEATAVQMGGDRDIWVLQNAYVHIRVDTVYCIIFKLDKQKE